MLKNYLTVALRTLRRHPGYAFINVFGLAVGIGACLLLLQYVRFELSYDTFHAHADDLYRLTNDRYQNDVLTQHGVITYPSVVKAIEQDYPEVLDYTRVTSIWRKYVRRQDTGFEEENGIFADSAFLGMFTFPLVEGDPATALARPYSVLLSERYAAKYFGSDWRQQRILGKTLTVDNAFDVTVTGVFEDVPANSHMAFDLLFSWATLGQAYGEEMEDSWTNSNFMGYLRLAPGTDPAVLERKLVDFSQRHFEGTKVSGSLERFRLQPLKDVHLYSDYEYELWSHGSGTAVWAMLFVAGLILVIAWLNYVNLTTARALERAKEVGVRKVVGAVRAHVVKQFLVEAALLNALGFAGALLLVFGGQPLLGTLLGIRFPGSGPSLSWAASFGLLFGSGLLLSGLYPALVVSAFKPVAVLKGSFVRTGRGRAIWKGLVVAQFALSFGLIAGTFTVHRQIRFMQDQDLGMNIDQVLVLRGPRLTPWDSTYFHNVATFKTEALRVPGVAAVTASSRTPGDRTGRIFDVRRGDGASDVQYTTGHIQVDHDFFETFEMEILAGRGFEASDHNLSWDALRSIVLNESAARLLGFEDAAGAVRAPLRFWDKEWEVVGVVADHHQQSLKVSKEPIVFVPAYSTGNSFFLKVAPERLGETLAGVRQAYLALFPGNTFDYAFLDAAFDAQYEADRRFRSLFTLFTVLGVVLACLGLFGLSLLSTARRRKEIGVRKVLGASAPGIAALLVRDFVKLVVLAMLVACPLAYLVLSEWLAGYAYHIRMDGLLFALPALCVLAVAVATVSYQTLRAALADPVRSLRTE